MKRYISLLIILILTNTGCAHQTENPTGSLNKAAVSNASKPLSETEILTKELVKREKLYSADAVHLYKYPDDNIYVAVIENQKDWWEFVYLCYMKDGKVASIKLLASPDDDAGYDILSLRFAKLKGFNNSLIEIYNKTHMGNGSFYLYELNSGKPNLILDTFAVDYNYEGSGYYKGDVFQYNISTLIKNEKLDVQYRDMNNDGYDDVILTGIVEYYKDSDEEWAHDVYTGELVNTEPWEKVFLYDITKNRFIKDETRGRNLVKYRDIPYYKDM
ncbi:MAG: hypothetical protein ACM3UZ_09590 [Acidobacteriota bacterium]